MGVRVAINLVTTTDQEVKRLLLVVHQKVHPQRVIATAESWTSKIIWVDTSAEAITLRARS